MNGIQELNSPRIEQSLCDFPCGLLLAVQSMLLVYLFLYINVRGNVCLSLDSPTSLDLLICCTSFASLLGKASIGTFFFNQRGAKKGCGSLQALVL